MDLEAKKAAARERARAARAAAATGAASGLVLTEAAARYVREASAAVAPVLQVRVTAGGCAGLEWHVDLADPDSAPTPEEREDIQHGVRVRQDLRAALHLAGATLDYGGDQFQRGFRLSTPQGIARCSCGASLGA